MEMHALNTIDNIHKEKAFIFKKYFLIMKEKVDQQKKFLEEMIDYTKCSFEKKDNDFDFSNIKLNFDNLIHQTKKLISTKIEKRANQFIANEEQIFPQKRVANNYSMEKFMKTVQILNSKTFQSNTLALSSNNNQKYSSLTEFFDEDEIMLMHQMNLI